MAKILKGGTTPARRIDAEVYEASRCAERIRAEAEAEALRIREAAEADRARVLEAARAAGREEGLAAASETVLRAAREREARLAATEGELVALALDIARKILGRELQLDPGAVADVAALALGEARERRSVTIAAHPDDLPALRAAEPRLAALLARAPSVALRADPALARGGVRIETELGVIDASLDTQLAALRRALDEAGAP